MTDRVEYAVIETICREVLLTRAPEAPQIGEVATPYVDNDGWQHKFAIVPVVDDKRIDGGQWPLRDWAGRETGIPGKHDFVPNYDQPTMTDPFFLCVCGKPKDTITHR